MSRVLRPSSSVDRLQFCVMAFATGFAVSQDRLSTTDTTNLLAPFEPAKCVPNLKGREAEP
jgi:hypothetical protein